MKSSSFGITFLTRKVIFATIVFIIVVTYLVRVTPSRKVLPPKDYYQLVDIPFQFLRTPVCKQTYKFLVIVHTSPANRNRRNLLRETWANVNETDIGILFLTGLERDKTLQMELNKEMRQYGNFIHGDFLDTYKNLTYKHIMGLKYVYYHCPNIQYVVKVDDDVFVNVQILKSFFETFLQRYGRTKNILCSTRIGHSVLRDGKWAVNTTEYPNTTYPPHCPGFAIIYPKTAVELLYNVAQETKFFWIDDVHVTGTVAKNAGVGHVDISALTMNNVELNVILEKNISLDMRPILFGPMETGEENNRLIFQYMKVHGRKISILEYLNN